jgi:hypothetical protein
MDWDYLIKIARDENNSQHSGMGGNSMGRNQGDWQNNRMHHGHHNTLK